MTTPLPASSLVDGGVAGLCSVPEVTGLPDGVTLPGVPGSGSPLGLSLPTATSASCSLTVGLPMPGLTGGFRGDEPVLPATRGP